MLSTLWAQTDSLSTWQPKRSIKPNRIESTRAFQMLEIPVILAATGLTYKALGNRFIPIRDGFTPHFKHHYDDYTQYLPSAVMLGLKVGGVESESSWSKMVTAYVFSYLIMGGVVNGLKRTTHIQRPDGVGYDSFPSGHTATAFMSATMLHKEYGNSSPWYSVGAYTIATTTGVTRMLNNKHSMSDVLVGAAIGIVSTELGYLFADIIFRREKSRYLEPSNFTFTKDHHPSFIEIYTGLSINMGKYTTSKGEKMTTDNGSRIGVEGAWFINPYLGVGGLFTASTAFINLYNDQVPNNLNILSASGGIYLSYPLSYAWRVGTKALAGLNHVYKHEELQTDLNIKESKINLQTGVSISYFAKRHLGFKLFTDYSHSPQLVNNRARNELIIGLSIGLIF